MAIGVCGGSKTLNGSRHLPVLVILEEDEVKHTRAELVAPVQQVVGCATNNLERAGRIIIIITNPHTTFYRHTTPCQASPQ